MGTAFRKLSQAIRAMSVERSKDVTALCRDTRVEVVERRRARRVHTQRLRLWLRRHRAAIVASLATKQPPVAPPPFDPSVPADVPSAAQAGGVWELCAETADSDEFAGNELRAAILHVIDAHPEGVRARDIGNELGVDWRRVLAMTPQLMDEGIVERVGQQFYSTGSRHTW